MPKATAVFDADDSRLSGALARINGKMLALQSRIAKFAAAIMWRLLVWLAVHPSSAAQVRWSASAARRKTVDGSSLIFRRAAPCHFQPRKGFLAAWRMWPMRTAFSWMRKKTR